MIPAKSQMVDGSFGTLNTKRSFQIHMFLLHWTILFSGWMDLFAVMYYFLSTVTQKDLSDVTYLFLSTVTQSELSFYWEKIFHCHILFFVHCHLQKRSHIFSFYQQSQECLGFIFLKKFSVFFRFQLIQLCVRICPIPLVRTIEVHSTSVTH